MKKNELIAVAQKNDIFKNVEYQEGIFPLNIKVINNIKIYNKEHIRYLAEEDYNFKQIVSYIVFIHRNNIFLMERSDTASEQKLKNKFSIGIGGHLNKEDLNKDLLFWGEREFQEEINYEDNLKNLNIKPIAIINDESNNIGKLHIGIVYIIHGASNKISIKSEMKSGKLVSLNKCYKYYNHLESWSQLTLNFLKDYLKIEEKLKN